MSARHPLFSAAGIAALLLVLAAAPGEARRPEGGAAGAGALAGLSASSLPIAALVRPGGGHTFSGGHSSSSSGHSFSGGSGFRSGSSFGSTPHGVVAPMVLGRGCGFGGCFSLFFLILVVLLILYLINKNRGGPPTPPAGQNPPDTPPAPDLDAIRGIDPEFSVVLFEDFAYALYAKAHESRGDRQQLDALAPYLSAEARAELAARPPVGAPVSGVVIGAMRTVGLSLPAGSETRPQVKVTLEFESNMTVGAGTGDATQYVRERWHLVRDASVQTKAPEAVRSFHCPNCGAPFGPGGGDRCEYCGEVVSGGRFDWSVVATEALEIESRPPALTGTVEEVGTDWPTIVHPALAERWAELQQADPASGEQALAARLQLIYQELNPAWTALDLGPVRGFVSDGLFDYLQYWIVAYQHQGLRNDLRDMRLTQWQTVKVVHDRHFDAVTFRIWATGRDTTVSQATGKVVGGNPNADRNYSEYWTLIRGAGVRGAPRLDKTCPNCGAPLEVNMAGKCNHCDAKITSGEFDWVLSKIEQDESYTG